MARPDQHTFACNSATDTSRGSLQALEFQAFHRAADRRRQGIACEIREAGVEGGGGPGCGAHGRWVWRDNESMRQANQQHTGPHWCEGRRRVRRAWLRCPWAVGLAGQRVDAPSQPTAHRAPLVWRAPEGPEGTGGLRGAAPNEVRTPSLAGGRGLRRPEHPWGHKQPGQTGPQAAWPDRATSSPAQQGMHTTTSGTGRRHDPRLGRQGTQS